MDGFIIVNPDPGRIAAIAAKHGLKAIKIGMRANRAPTFGESIDIALTEFDRIERVSSQFHDDINDASQ